MHWVLLEATNLLVIPRRRVAVKGFPQTGLCIQLAGDSTELGNRQPEFDGFAQACAPTGRRALAANRTPGMSMHF